MPRRRSSIVKKANPGWHGIERLDPKEFFSEAGGPNKRISSFFEKHLASAKELAVEIGPGSGDFILEAARKRPQTLFVGIEYAARFIQYCRDCRDAVGLKNVLLVSTDARPFLMRVLPENSVDVFHVYFPDPWPKPGHQKKRTMGSEGLELLMTRLKPGGLIYFATDHQGYAEDVREILRQFPGLKILKSQVFQGPHLEMPPYYASYGKPTHFGAKYLKEDRAIAALKIQKTELA